MVVVLTVPHACSLFSTLTLVSPNYGYLTYAVLYWGEEGSRTTRQISTGAEVKVIALRRLGSTAGVKASVLWQDALKWVAANLGE